MRSFFTDFTPGTCYAVHDAWALVMMSRISPVSAILVFAVSHESLTSAFSLDMSTAMAGTAMSAAPTTRVVQNARTARVLMIFLLTQV